MGWLLPTLLVVLALMMIAGAAGAIWWLLHKPGSRPEHPSGKKYQSMIVGGLFSARHVTEISPEVLASSTTHLMVSYSFDWNARPIVANQNAKANADVVQAFKSVGSLNPKVNLYVVMGREDNVMALGDYQAAGGTWVRDLVKTSEDKAWKGVCDTIVSTFGPDLITGVVLNWEFSTEKGPAMVEAVKEIRQAQPNWEIRFCFSLGPKGKGSDTSLCQTSKVLDNILGQFPNTFIDWEFYGGISCNGLESEWTYSGDFCKTNWKCGQQLVSGAIQTGLKRVTTEYLGGNPTCFSSNFDTTKKADYFRRMTIGDYASDAQAIIEFYKYSVDQGFMGVWIFNLYDTLKCPGMADKLHAFIQDTTN